MPAAVCPVCNGLAELRCPRCGAVVRDRGLLHQYLGPYSAYMEINDFYQPDAICHHLYQCLCSGPELMLAGVTKVIPGHQ